MRNWFPNNQIKGHLVLGALEHNHAADPEDYVAKQARAKLREGVEETGGSVADAVHQVFNKERPNEGKSVTFTFSGGRWNTCKLKRRGAEASCKVIHLQVQGGEKESSAFYIWSSRVGGYGGWPTSGIYQEGAIWELSVGVKLWVCDGQQYLWEKLESWISQSSMKKLTLKWPSFRECV